MPKLTRPLGEGTFELAQIKSRTVDAETAYGYLIDREWFEKDDWSVNRLTFNEVSQGSTEIVVGASESLWNEESIASLKRELGKTYVNFLTGKALDQSGDFEILVNGERVDPSEDVEWSYLPLDDLYPRRYKNIEIDASYLSTPIQMEVEVGLMLNTVPDKAGTDIYFQDRLVIANATSEDGGYGAEESSLGRFGTNHDRLKVKLELHTAGDASELPWDTQKKNIDRTTRISSEMYSKLGRFVKPYFNADSKIITEPIATPYDKESTWASNHGTVKTVDTSGNRRHERPRTSLRQVKRLRDIANYHVVRGVYVDYSGYDRIENDPIDEEAVPAYTLLVQEIADDKLEPVSPEEGMKIVKEVKEVRRMLRSIPMIGESKIDRIIESGYISVEDLRDASVSELRRIHGIGGSIAHRIKNRLEPSEGMEFILEELISKPADEEGLPDEDRVFDLYESILEFDSLPSSTDVEAVVDNGFPLLNSNGEYTDAADLYIPDDREVVELFEDSGKIHFTKIPDTKHRNIKPGELFDLLKRLGASKLSEAVESSVFKRGVDDSTQQDPTPAERLESVWKAIESEIGSFHSIERPSVVWVDETGIRYQLDNISRERPSNCEYDSDKDELYLTPDFVVDWDMLADRLVRAHSGDRETVASILREAPEDLEDRAVEIIRQHESENFRAVIDVRNAERYEGENVEGCDVIAFPYEGGAPRFIEIKARTSLQSPIHLIGREPTRAGELGQQYYLYVVVINDRLDSVRLWRLSNPASREYVQETAWRINQRTWQQEGEEVIIR